MDITNATIEWIGEITPHQTEARLKIAIDVSTNSTPKKRYIIFQNENYSFDLIKNFKAKVYQIGDKIDFNFNIPRGNYYPSIWKIANHKRKS